MNSPDLTVVIAARNPPDAVLGAVDSALSQPGRAVEVVVDDSSACPPTVASRRPMRLVRLDPGQGPAAARNAGLGAARGRWITLLDDDRLFPVMADASLSAIAAPIDDLDARDHDDRRRQIGSPGTGRPAGRRCMITSTPSVGLAGCRAESER